MLLNSLRALLQFTTILPLGKTADFSLFAKHSYLYPVAGYVTGGIAGLASFWIMDPGIRAAAATACVLLVTGANHFDGLLDLGDGLMAHGGREHRVRALSDRQIGTGAYVAGAVVLLFSFAALFATEQVLAAIIAAEVLAKFSMSFLTSYGVPFREGLHASLHGESRPWFPVISAIICLPLLVLPLSRIALIGAGLVALAVPASLLVLANRLFGGVNGDVVGASGEITRAVVLCALVLLPAGTVF